ncbi:MAG: hypothetical protein CMA64_05480 [Euryarchaeota archaeon]|nr:hypothetical protein [Euryarchaeota archaeon]
MDDEDKKFVEANVKVIDLIQKLLTEGMSPIQVASILQANATRIYRATLSEDEYKSLLETIWTTDPEDFHKETIH